MSRLLVIFSFAITLTLCLPAMAVNSKKYRVYKIKSNDGLNSNIVRDITQDESGYMWFATIHGLYRYDGYTMKQVISKENMTSGLIPDIRTVSLHKWGERFLWVRLRGNFFCCYDLYKNQFVNYNEGHQLQPFTSGCFENSQEVWLYGGEKGCQRVTFNNEQFKVSVYPLDSGGLPDGATIHFIRQGLDGRFWIGTNKGLLQARNGQLKAMGSSKHDVRCYVARDKKEYFVCGNGTILSYKRGKLSVLTSGTESMVGVAGAFAYSDGLIITTKGDTYEYHDADHSVVRSTTILLSRCQILYDDNNNALLWTSTDKDIYYVRAKDLHISTAKLPNGAVSEKRPITQLRMTATQQGNIVITSFGQGLFVYHPEQGTVDHYTQQWGSDALVNTNYLLDVFEDRLGNLWISQEDLGISCITPIKSETDFLLLNPGYSAYSDMHDNHVRMLRRTSNGTIYVASFTNLLFTYDGESLKKIENPWGSILSVANDNMGTRWLGTRQGVVVGDKLFKHDSNDASSVASNKISDLCLDWQGRMWVAAFGGGLDVATANSQTSSVSFRHFFTGNEQQREARCLLLDHHGRMWLGAGDGCYVFDPNQLLRDEKAYQHLTAHENSKMDEVHALCEDSHHHMWVAIAGTGLACWDNSGDKPRLLRLYTTADGLSDIAVQSVLEDTKGIIYVGTNRGINVLDETQGQFHNYQLGSTQLANVMMENAACRLNDGRLAFGTKDGLMVLSPSQLTASHGNTFLAITDIMVNGVPVNEVSPLNDAVEHAKTIKLDYDQNSLTFHFSDFRFTGSPNSQYTYKLEGYDNDWQSLTTSNTATYRNLKSGNYKLLLRSCSSEGVWNTDTKELSIVIRPPFWLTWYAYLFYALLIGAAAFQIYRQLKHVNELHNQIKIEQQLSEYKVQFFTNISHEFRTPLTIIQGAMEHIRETGNIPGNMKQPLGNMQKSVKRLSRLISRLMDFRKVQENQLELAVEETDVVAFLRDIWMTFRDVADNRRISYQFMTFANTYTIPVDRRKLDSIAYNLISNALKYTPAGGTIIVRIRLSENSKMLLFEVKDTGIGVSKERQQHLFQNYMQAMSSYDSIGIGLHLSYQLAKLHKGDLSFSENPDGGSIFLLSLPADKSIYAESDYTKEMAATILDDSVSKEKWLEDYKETPPQPLNDRILLIVEDDDDVREFLSTELRNYFNIQQAHDGREAWELISEQRPDIIVSDVSMPVMNGFELTKRIKSDQSLSDIPVILLTALADDMKRERGFHVGADEYIQKPFSIRTLIARLSQLLEQRDKLRNSYSAIEAAPVIAVVKDERDRKFLNTLDSWIYNHMSDTSLNVDDLATNMGFGRSSFYRKVNSLTGMTPNNYIRRIRMEKSKELLEETNLTVSEISYKTGFSSAFYFSKCFKEYYGMSPSQFRNGEKA